MSNMKTVTFDEQTHRIVPIEPTDDMLIAGFNNHYRLDTHLGCSKAIQDYENILFSAPDFC